ncbi:META domain-containing protein [Gilvimarinus agarilyticus]|uniref:META domain-containing protein n=1 Tax=Gilvimarinus agarilyticus TaxID=679259 RepID=UPI000697E8B7|nr:META domain-containing protein [Gilvimarinus agarilyticus]
MLIRLSLLILIVATTLGAGCTLSSTPTSTSTETANINGLNLLGEWRVEYIAGRGVIDYSPARVRFNEDGKLNGNASCNRFFGDYQQDGQRLIIKEPLGATRMLCVPALNEQEERLLAALPGTHNIAIRHGILTLTDDGGNEVLRAAKLDPTDT